MNIVRKVDENQKEIVAAFRKFGYSVAHTHTIGKGFPDIIVAKNLCTILVEIKDGKKAPSKRKLTPDEEKFHNEWQGQMVIIESVDDVVKFCNASTRKHEN